jgi:hypothetical protein
MKFRRVFGSIWFKYLDVIGRYGNYISRAISFFNFKACWADCFVKSGNPKATDLGNCAAKNCVKLN